MLLDITLPITPAMLADAIAKDDPSLAGHLGTHFDVMDSAFPPEYTRRPGIVFDVSAVGEREIGIEDVDLTRVETGMFVGFYSGYIERVDYGAPGYFANHPVLSYALIEQLLDKGVSVIGLDFGGVRRSGEHTPTDRHCAKRGTFIVENLVNLKPLADSGRPFTAHIYPMRLEGLTGLPCRVFAEI